MDKITHQVFAEYWIKFMNEYLKPPGADQLDFRKAVLLLAEDPAKGSF